jgi:hypothetical protein
MYLKSIYNKDKCGADVPSAGDAPSACDDRRARRSHHQTAAISIFVISLFSFLTACRQDMHDQPKYEPLESSAFFDDHRSARIPPEGTVPRGFLREDTALYTGKINNEPVQTFPMEITEQVVQRGQERYNIFCAPCHDKTGHGIGMVVQRGFKKPPSFHLDRMRQAPVGHYYDVITNGFGVMLNYAEQVPVEDRWAIIAYIRALQMSQHATVSELPAEDQKKLQEIGSRK